MRTIKSLMYVVIILTLSYIAIHLVIDFIGTFPNISGGAAFMKGIFIGGVLLAEILFWCCSSDEFNK